MIAQIPIDTSLTSLMTLSSIRVHTQANIIDLTITCTITIITALGKATLTGPAKVVEERDTLPSTAPNRPFSISGATLPPTTMQLADPNPGKVDLWNHPVQAATMPLSHQNNTTLQLNHQLHTTQPSPAPSGNEEWAKLLVIRMEEWEYTSR